MPAEGDFRASGGFRTLDDRSDAPARPARLPARPPARAGRRPGGGPRGHGEGAVGADAPGGRRLGRATSSTSSRAASSTRSARGRRGCRPRSRSSTRPRPRCGGWGRPRGSRPRRWPRRRPPPACVRGDLYLRGSGDPNFDVVDSSNLAQQVAQAGIRRITGRVIGDESAFDTRRGVPSSGFALSSDVGGPLSALTFNRGRTGRSAPYFQNRPANFAATFFAKQLRHLGVDVARGARRGRTADGGRAGRRLALGPARRPAAPDEPAVGQLHGRDADQGRRLAVRRGGEHRGRRAGRDRRARGARDVAADRRRVGPLALRPHVAERRRDAARGAAGRRRVHRLARAWPGGRGRSPGGCAAPRRRTAAAPRPGRCATSPRWPATARPASAARSPSRSS